ncbi:MAG TPA: 3'-5' exonuclease [Pyrinomonadaceae bacterium]|nr:3'-5' exonuclease [Pyrinomonadaceae bacterium]
MSDRNVIVWDLETIPDLSAARRILDFHDKSDDEVRVELVDAFPKLPLHSIVCIGALVASQGDHGWMVQALGAPNVGDRSEAELITAFVAKIAEYEPRLVTFSGNGFDLPVLRYRALLHSIPAPGLIARPYFNRFTEDAVDLCDVLASFSPRARAKLDELARFFGLPGKPSGIDGSAVAGFVREGRIREVSDYCETDVVSTYRIWLRYELFKGTLDPQQLAASEKQLAEFIERRQHKNPYLGKG